KHIRPETPVDVKIACVPTLQCAFSWYCCPQKVLIDVVRDDHGISQLLLDCARNLARVNEEVQSTECRAVLAKWWNVWRILKDLAIPLDIYERYRVHAQGRGSLENAIDRVASSADRIYTSEGKSLRLVAPVIGNRLRSIYQALSQACPKADRLMSLLNQTKSDTKRDMLFILSEKSQVDALREHFLFTDVDLLDTRVPIVHLAQAVPAAHTKLLSNCVLPGAWAPWQESILVAIGASTLTVLMYPYEATLVETRVQEHTSECADLAKTTPSKHPYAPIIILPREQVQVLTTIKQLTEEETTVAQPPEWLKVEPEFAFDALESEERITEEEQIAEGLLIRFDDGSDVVVRPHSEMMLITEDGVENVFASALSEGDTVVVMRDAITRSIFQSVLAQVNHLVRADDRVIELWRSSIKKVYFEGQYRSTSAIIRALRNLGCRRVELTIRQWFRGTTLAPQDTGDIARVLELAGVQRASEVARVVCREIEIVRAFNRRLGRRIREQIKASITGHVRPARERIDFEIDEAIEAVEYKTIASIKNFSGDH
ncbi:MAG: DrmE family protein, partial [Promethearchaeati archaeon]